jgi:phosphatidylinositol alpha-1,6-mannosyltransferase
VPVPRISIVTPELHRRGGTERSLLEQLSRWVDRFDVRVYSTKISEGVPSVRTIPVVPAPQIVRFASWVVGNHVMRALDGYRDGRPDAVVSPGINALDADVIGVHMIFARHLEDRHGDPGSWLRRAHRHAYHALVAALERRVYAGPATLWAISNRDARELERRFQRPAGTVPVVPHGVDAEVFAPPAIASRRDRVRQERDVTDRTVVLVVGNDIASKGIDLAIAAVPHMPEDVTVAVAGRLDPTSIEGLAQAVDTPDRVVVWSHGDPIDHYAAADLVLAPSREDSFNLPVLEAMACGVPVVVSDRAGVAELLTDGVDATVLHDLSPAAIATSVKDLLTSTGAMAARSAAGRAFAERHTWDGSAQRAADLISHELTTPRVLLLATDPGRIGGIQRATRTLARALADRYGEDRVGVLAVWVGERSFPGRVLRDGRGGEGPVGAIARVEFAAAAIAAARRWRRRGVMVVAHPHLAPAAWIARAFSGMPYVVWCHGTEVWNSLPPLAGEAIRRADLVFAPSSFTAQRVEAVAGLPPGSVHIAVHCVPPEAAPARGELPTFSDREPGTVLTVARLSSEHAYKGVDTLIAAWPKVVAACPEARLVVVGDGSDRRRLEMLATNGGVGDAISFPGAVDDAALRALYRTVSLFAMPARHRLAPVAEGEGFGLVFVEAGAWSLPVIAGRGAGADDAVVDGVSGLLVDPEAPDPVADAIVALLTDRDRAERLAEGGRALATSRFSYESFGDAMDQLIREAASEALLS